VPLERNEYIHMLSDPGKEPIYLEEKYLLGVYFFYGKTKVEHRK
jgi:hypothetical protein